MYSVPIMMTRRETPWPDRTMAGSMSSRTRGGTKLTMGQDRGRLSPCVCNTLRMVTRVVT